jgi:hypothetical protein
MPAKEMWEKGVWKPKKGRMKDSESTINSGLNTEKFVV